MKTKTNKQKQKKTDDYKTIKTEIFKQKLQRGNDVHMRINLSILEAKILI